MALSELMTELAAGLGIDSPQLDADGGAQLLVNDDLAIDVAPNEDGAGFTVSATVAAIPATIPHNARETLFEKMLQANLLGDGTGGGALALDGELGEVVLCRVFPQTDMPVTVLDRELAEFANALRWWRERFARIESGGRFGRELGGEPASEDARTSDTSGMLRI